MATLKVGVATQGQLRELAATILVVERQQEELAAAMIVAERERAQNTSAILSAIQGAALSGTNDNNMVSEL